MAKKYIIRTKTYTNSFPDSPDVSDYSPTLYDTEDEAKKCCPDNRFARDGGEFTAYSVEQVETRKVYVTYTTFHSRQMKSIIIDYYGKLNPDGIRIAVAYATGNAALVPYVDEIISYSIVEE